jgi:hypothetical protein
MRWALLLLFTTCLGAGQAAVRRQTAGDSAGAPGMARIAAGGESFWMDRFEMSEIRSGEFFSARNHVPKTHITAREAAEVCAKQKKKTTLQKRRMDKRMPWPPQNAIFVRKQLPRRCL